MERLSVPTSAADHLAVAPEMPLQLILRPPLRPGDAARIANRDDLVRSRLTVFFRFFMALPHLIWLSIWGFGMVLLAPVVWVAALVKGQPPETLREVYVIFIRYATQVYAFLYLAAEPFPGFLGSARYPVDVEIPPSGPQSRWSIGFRFFLAFPPLMLTSVFVGIGGGGSGTGSSAFGLVFSSSGGVALTTSFCAWWAVMIRGRMPPGLRDLTVYALGYAAQLYAYLLLVTGRYPNANPALAQLAPLPAHPIRLEMSDELRRNRWIVAFRLALIMPHLVWAVLWGVVVLLASIVTWLVTLILGRTPSPLHRFLGAYVRYTSHLFAFSYLGGGPFPGFTGKPGMYPVDFAIDGPVRQNRWTVAFRGVLALPALFIAGAVGTAAGIAAIGAWFYALFLGRAPEGVRNLIVFASRYNAQTYGYVLFVTPAYPYSGPSDFSR